MVHTPHPVTEPYSTYPWPPYGSLPPQPVFSTCSHPDYLLPRAQAIFRAKSFLVYIPHSQPQSHFIPTRL
jgi:hypothetical protein